MLQSTKVLQSIMHENHQPYNDYDYNRKNTYNVFQQQLNTSQRRINLLDQYAKCLQKQNRAKSTEIQMLHQRLNRVQSDNENLRDAVRQMRHSQSNKDMVKTAQNSFNRHTIILQCKDMSIQTLEYEQKQDYEQLKQDLEQFHYKIQEKDLQINKYQKEGQEMFLIIQQLQRKLKQSKEIATKDKQTIRSLQNALQTKQQHIEFLNQQLMNSSQNQSEIRNNVCVNYEMQIKLSELISQNNNLIQQNRLLQRQKNEYYNEVKRCSRLSFGKENLSKSNLKPSRIKDQRFRQIQQNLRRIKLENKQLQANLQIQ